jgi:hypothetical protein
LLVSFLGTIFGGFCISLVVSSALERKTAPQPAAPKPAAAALPPKTDHKK